MFLVYALELLLCHKPISWWTRIRGIPDVDLDPFSVWDLVFPSHQLPIYGQSLLVCIIMFNDCQKTSIGWVDFISTRTVQGFSHWEPIGTVQGRVMAMGKIPAAKPSHSQPESGLVPDGNNMIFSSPSFWNVIAT